MRVVLVAVGDDCNEHGVGFGDILLQMIDGETDGIVEWGAGAGIVILGLQVLDVGDGFAVADKLDGTRLEGHKGDILLLFGILLLCTTNGLEGFVDTGEGLTLDAAH